MALPVTALFAALLGLWIVVLIFKVVGFRFHHTVILGDGGHEHGLRLIRGHANATETIPIFLIMLGLAEGLGSPAWLLYGLGAMFTTGRLMHGGHFLMARPVRATRFYGMILTVTATVVVALDLLRHSVGL